MVEIIPAILPTTFEELCHKIGLLDGLAPVVQIDICDGKFVPSKTWPYQGNTLEWDKIHREVVGMPRWKDFDFEIDLMVDRPETIVSDWISAGASRVFAHVEASMDFETMKNFCENKVELGLAINSTTPLEQLWPFLVDIAVVQCMGIERIGFQGQPFDERVLKQISDLRSKNPNLTISVDGGVNLESARRLLAAGANRLVIGSALFGSGDLAGTLRAFRNLTI